MRPLTWLFVTLAIDQRGVLLSRTARRTRPRSSKSLSSLRPSASMNGVAPVRMAISLIIFLAAIAEARSLDRRHLQHAAHAVHHECGERLALHVLGGDDQERSASSD